MAKRDARRRNGLIGATVGLTFGVAGALIGWSFATNDRNATAQDGPPAPAGPAYLLVQGEITDREKFGAYIAALPPIYAQYGGTYLVVTGDPSVVEGDWSPPSVVISKWPSREAAEAFWASPEYDAARQLREGAGTFSVMILPGLPEAPAQ